MSGNDFHASHADFLPLPKKQEVVSHPVNEWNIGSARNVLGPRNSDWCIGHIFPCPNQSRWLQMDTSRSCRGKALLRWREHPYPLFRKKACLHPLSSTCWTCTAILVSASSWSHLCISLEPLLVTTDSSEVIFTSLFSGNWKFETLLVRGAKSFFLFVLSYRNVFQFRGILVSGRIFDTICLVCIPDNVHPFTWLEINQHEWDEDVFSRAIKSGNSCGWKSINNSCSIKDLAVVKWRWIRLFCTNRLNTRQEVWPHSESQLSKLGQRWWVGLVFVHKKFV